MTARHPVQIIDVSTGKVLADGIMLTEYECKALSNYVAPSRIRQALVWCVQESWKLKQQGEAKL